MSALLVQMIVPGGLPCETYLAYWTYESDAKMGVQMSDPTVRRRRKLLRAAWPGTCFLDHIVPCMRRCPVLTGLADVVVLVYFPTMADRTGDLGWVGGVGNPDRRLHFRSCAPPRYRAIVVVIVFAVILNMVMADPVDRRPSSGCHRTGQLRRSCPIRC